MVYFNKGSSASTNNALRSQRIARPHFLNQDGQKRGAQKTFNDPVMRKTPLHEFSVLINPSVKFCKTGGYSNEILEFHQNSEIKRCILEAVHLMHYAFYLLTGRILNLCEDQRFSHIQFLKRIFIEIPRPDHVLEIFEIIIDHITQGKYMHALLLCKRLVIVSHVNG